MPRVGWPDPADFAAPPSAAERATWDAADRAARPDRLDRLRARFGPNDIDAYFDIRPEHMRYLTGLALGEGEEKVAGDSGRFLVSGDEVAVLADSRYTIQVASECPDARVVAGYNDLAERWAELVGSVGARRVGIEPAFISHALWGRLEAAAPNVDPRPGGWLGRGGPSRQGAGRARTGRGGLCRGGSGAGGPPAGDPPGRDRGDPRAAARVVDADERRRSARVRCRLPCRTAGGAAARGARRPAGPGRGGAPVRLRRPGGRLPKRHDPHALRRRATQRRPGDLRAGGQGPGGRHPGPRAGRRRRSGLGPMATRFRMAGRSTPSRGTSSTPPATAITSATGRATGSASPPTRPQVSASGHPARHCRARPSSRWNPACTSRVRRASGSRTWSCWTERPAASSD